MASQSIITMTPASVVNNTDLLPISQGGSNLSASRAQLLQAASTEDLTLSSAAAQVQLAKLGNVAITVAAGQNFIVLINSVGITSLSADPVGTRVEGPVGGYASMGANGGQVLIDISGHVTIIDSGPTSCFVQYSSPNPTFWKGFPPTSLDAAVTRLAAAVHGLLGGIIP